MNKRRKVLGTLGALLVTSTRVSSAGNRLYGVPVSISGAHNTGREGLRIPMSADGDGGLLSTLRRYTYMWQDLLKEFRNDVSMKSIKSNVIAKYVDEGFVIDENSSEFKMLSALADRDFVKYAAIGDYVAFAKKLREHDILSDSADIAMRNRIKSLLKQSVDNNALSSLRGKNVSGSGKSIDEQLLDIIKEFEGMDTGEGQCHSGIQRKCSAAAAVCVAYIAVAAVTYVAAATQAAVGINAVAYVSAACSIAVWGCGSDDKGDCQSACHSTSGRDGAMATSDIITPEIRAAYAYKRMTDSRMMTFAFERREELKQAARLAIMLDGKGVIPEVWKDYIRQEIVYLFDALIDEKIVYVPEEQRASVVKKLQDVVIKASALDDESVLDVLF